jgi:hypothetical protein
LVLLLDVPLGGTVVVGTALAFVALLLVGAGFEVSELLGLGGALETAVFVSLGLGLPLELLVGATLLLELELAFEVVGFGDGVSSFTSGAAGLEVCTLQVAVGAIYFAS